MADPAQAVEASNLEEASSAEEDAPSSLDECTVERISQGALI